METKAKKTDYTGITVYGPFPQTHLLTHKEPVMLPPGIGDGKDEPIVKRPWPKTKEPPYIPPYILRPDNQMGKK